MKRWLADHASNASARWLEVSAADGTARSRFAPAHLGLTHTRRHDLLRRTLAAQTAGPGEPLTLLLNLHTPVHGMCLNLRAARAQRERRVLRIVRVDVREKFRCTL